MLTAPLRVSVRVSYQRPPLRLVTMSAPYWETSRRHGSMGPPPVPPRPGTLMYKYEDWLKRWPKAFELHRMVIDGLHFHITYPQDRDGASRT